VSFGVAFTLFVAAAIGYNFNNASNSKPDGSVSALSDINISSNSGGASGMIAIPGYDHIVMKAGQKVQNIELGNPKQNNCYMRIAIMLPDGTQLYESGLLAPGQVLNSIELSQELKPGMYEGAILSYSCYGMKEIKELNGAKTIFKLEVKP
jgi:hypothetical protein